MEVRIDNQQGNPIAYTTLLNSVGCTFMREVANRRGAALLQVRQGDSLLALKLNVSNADDGAYDPIALLDREASVLQRLGGLAGNLYVDHGVFKDQHWLLLRWLDGETVSEPGRVYRAMENDHARRTAFLDLFANILEKYVAVHTAGFMHGDVQTHHVFMTSGKPLIIDWGLGKHVGDTDYIYRGGLVHFVSPETAKEMLIEAPDIHYDTATEMYAIAAMFFILYTGKTPVYYGTDDVLSVPLEDKLKFVAHGDIISFEKIGIKPFPELESALRKCLSSDKDERLSSAALLQKIQALK